MFSSLARSSFINEAEKENIEKRTMAKTGSPVPLLQPVRYACVSVGPPDGAAAADCQPVEEYQISPVMLSGLEANAVGAFGYGCFQGPTHRNSWLIS
ncbi:hypothetical protein PABG_02061 [Paracoccidioides brasiliensis Pb03]|nr:hypothetical protein PABG_02061 [Paracoccidioides brasiliensis Pb03]